MRRREFINMKIAKSNQMQLLADEVIEQQA
jgi:hypothetical protein